MKPIRILAILAYGIFALPTLAGQQQEPEKAQAAHAAEVQVVLDKTYSFSSTWNRGAIDDYINFYEQSEEFALYYSGGQKVGIDDARDLYYSEWPSEQKMGKFDVFDVKARLLSPTTALSHGMFQHRFPDKTVNGNFSLTWIKSEGSEWKIAHEHSARISVEAPQ